ncbi:ferredoxin [Planctomycetota bacterium]
MKAIVDPDLCTACGLCVDACPEVFALGDDDDVARVIVDPVPADAEDACREAAEECPVEAISLGG